MIMRSDTCFLTRSHLSSFSLPRNLSISWVRSEMPGKAEEPYLLNLAGANRECLVSGLKVQDLSTERSIQGREKWFAKPR